MKKVLSAVAVSMLPVAAQAATISDSYGLPVALSTTEINQTGQLDRFDGTLGTLTDATLTLYGGAVFDFSGTNTAAQAQTARISSLVDLNWGSSIGALNSLLSSRTITMSATSGLSTYAVGQTLSFSGLTDFDLATVGLSGILASLTGSGAFGVTCQSSSFLIVQGGGGNIATTQSTRAGCGAEITYTYTPGTVTPPPGTVPEPGSLALVGLALAGMAFAGRRRKV